MIVENQTVSIKWGTKNRKYYEEKGYLFTNYGDRINVKISDLTLTSEETVEVICDCCGKRRTTKYCRYIQSLNKYGNYFCSKCTPKRSLPDRREKIYNNFLDFCNRHDYIPVTQKNELSSIEDSVTYICKIHGENTITIKTMMRDMECYQCTRKLVSQRWEDNLIDRQNAIYEKLIEKSDENGYSLISSKEDIKGYKSYISYECPMHGIKKMKVGNYISGKCCPDCRNELNRKLFKLPLQEVINRILECGGELMNPNDYINKNKKNLMIKCPSCGVPFKTSLVNFTQHGGQLCPECSKTQSIGESKIQMYLEERNIQFYPEHWFKECRDIKPLPFDFYLPQLNTIIEFDGKQHFEEISCFSDTPLLKIQSHDTIKNNFCEQEGIRLIRIPYWEINNIESILDHKLNK